MFVLVLVGLAAGAAAFAASSWLWGPLAGVVAAPLAASVCATAAGAILAHRKRSRADAPAIRSGEDDPRRGSRLWRAR